MLGLVIKDRRGLMGNKMKAVTSPAKLPASKKATPREMSAPKEATN